MLEKVAEPVLINTGDIGHPVPVSEAILRGSAPDGESFTYSSFPEITFEELSALQGADHATIFHAVTNKFLGTAIPEEVQRSIAEETYSTDNFDFDDGKLRMVKLPSGIVLAGLSDGPTGAFKDMAMQPMARWTKYLHEQKGGDPLTIMLATSGDTGPAALDAFSGLAEIINMLPKEGVSEFQWAQMAEAGERDDVHILEVDGDFTTADKLRRRANEDYYLGAANSVNIARVIAQTAYHVATYLRTIEVEGRQIGDPVDISIPSGNFGNVLSAIIAREMGVPFRKIIVATNENNTLDRLVQDGVFRLTEYQRTDSSAQDIEMPSNVWRYFMMMFGNDPEKVARVYEKLNEDGEVVIDDIGVENERVRDGIMSATVYKDERAQVITDTYLESGGSSMIEFHTANAIAALLKLQRAGKLDISDPGILTAATETAKPYKFTQLMMELLGVPIPRPKRFVGLEERQAGKELFQIADYADLRAYLNANTSARAKSSA